MYRLLTSSEIRQAEARAAAAGVSSLSQMEAAAAKAGIVACAMLAGWGQSLTPETRILILCGRGNNGGDGIALARHLRCAGATVDLMLCAGDQALTVEAAANLAAWQAGGGEALTPEGTPDFWRLLSGRLAAAPALVIDALLGTGQTRSPAGAVARTVSLVRGAQAVGNCPVLALDVPTGLSADTGCSYEPYLPATATVTFGLPKPGLFTGDGPDLAGEITLASLGWPEPEPAGNDLAGRTYLLTAHAAQQGLPSRPAGVHKGDAGRVLILAGSGGMSGAAVLSGLGAIRGGAGLLTVATPSSQQSVVAGALAEAMTLPLPETADGRLLAADGGAVDSLLAAAGGDAVAAGPGLRGGQGVRAVLERLLSDVDCPLVLDADALNAFAGSPEALATGPPGRPLIVTPHPGELSRLLGCPIGQVAADRLAAARRLSGITGAICLLKGRGTVIVSPAGPAYLIPAGNPGMATGGMGDVLTGLVAAVAAAWNRVERDRSGQAGGLSGLALRVAAAALVHAVAGDLAALDCGSTGLLASDVAVRLPRARDLICGLAPAPPALARSLGGVKAVV